MFQISQFEELLCDKGCENREREMETKGDGMHEGEKKGRQTDRHRGTWKETEAGRKIISREDSGIYFWVNVLGNGL